MSDSHKDSCHTVMRVPHDICTGCAACYAVCPVSCIAMEPDVEGFVYPKVDLTACTNCGLCVKTCPALKEPAAREPIDVYAAINKDEEVRARSSSGGVFWELGANCINQGGVVFGAGWSSDLRVIHKAARTLAELKDLQGSKYVQSDIGDTYQEAKKLLDAGVQVLFSGTPCQIAGLRAFLRKEYDHLLCVDLICYGVPSPLFFKKYIAYLSYIKQTQVSVYKFRHKVGGWQSSGIFVLSSKDNAMTWEHSNDPYMLAYFKTLTLRDCCYKCIYAKTSREGDITLGDFWKIDIVLPEYKADDSGTSVIITTTEKAQMALEPCKDRFKLQKTTIDKVIIGNPCLIAPFPRPNARSLIYGDLMSQPFEKVIEKYRLRPLTFAERVVHGVKRRIKALW